jgi:hypothetical protein
MGPATKATADRLVAAISAYNKDGKHDKLMARAATGEFGDYNDTHVCPITELHTLCRRYGLSELAARVADGEFDASKEDSLDLVRTSAPTSHQPGHPHSLQCCELFCLRNDVLG